MSVKVKRVTFDDIKSCYCCMTEIPAGTAWAEALPESRIWFEENLGKHVEGYHASEDEKVIGHIYWGSSENALVPYRTESKVACIYCSEMLRFYMHRGYGKKMFDFMKSDLERQGFKGIMVDATSFSEFMHYEHFVKQGFRTIKEHEGFKLMYFPLSKETVEAEPLRLSYKPSKEKVEVTLFKHFFCPVGACTYKLFKRVAQGFGEEVKLVEVEITMETMRMYGTTAPLINGKIKMFGPSNEKDIEKAIREEIERFQPASDQRHGQRD